MIEHTNKADVGRRAFLAASPLLVLSTSLMDASQDGSQAARQKPALSDELSAAEIEIVGKSKMAGDLGNFFGKGHSCAESGLAVALRFLDKPPELEWIAAGFGGGIQQRDLCGFLTGGVMALGLQAGALKLDKNEAKAACSRSVNDYWQWWTSTAPLHCSEIREGRDVRVCQRLGRLAVAKVEELMTRSSSTQ